MRIIGAATSLGQPRSGVEHGPAAIRKAGLVKEAERLGYRVEDCGDLDVNTPIEGDGYRGDGKSKTNRPRSVGQACRRINEACRDGRKLNQFVLTLGGDHSLAMGTISAALAADPETCVIWVDAHGDINTPDSTESGNIHGMPVAFLADLDSVRETPGFDWLEYGCLKPERIAFVGLRDVDPDEQLVLKKAGIRAFSMHDVDKYGIARVMEMALQAVDPEGKRPLHLSFDIDGLDPIHAPSTGTMVTGGLSLREGRYIAEAMAETGRLRSMDLVEVNPSLRPEGLDTTVQSALIIIKAALGHTLTK